MLKNFKYRIYPTKSQASKLNQILEECRWLWNHSLEQRKNAWLEDKKNISNYEQNAELPKLKSERPSLKLVHSQVLQNVQERLDLAFKAFFRRIKKGEKPGYPRFKGKNRYDSFCYPQTGWKLKGNKIFLSKIGYVPIILHRNYEGTIKRCTVKRTPTGKWFVTLCCETNIEAPVIQIKKIVGVDLGIKSFAVLSDGVIVENPRYFKEDKSALAKAQRKYSSQKTKRNKKVVTRIHERIANRRTNFSHQLSRELVNQYDAICIEDLNINRMKEDSYKVLNREISDTAWISFADKLSYKAEWAGKKVVKVNPAYTSQDCSNCGYRVEKKLSDRMHKCPNCGLKIDRDLNAALNILALGTQCLALA